MHPIKAGICKMALGAIHQNGNKVMLIPCALHCYKQHLFRSNMIVEYG
jgi:hypothetical protein